MSEREQREVAQEWVRDQVSRVEGEGQDLEEIPTSELRARTGRLGEQAEAAKDARRELARVRMEMGEEPAGLKRRRDALWEEKDAAEQRKRRIEEHISQRPEQEEELIEALRTVRDNRFSRDRGSSVERAHALLKAGRLRMEIRRSTPRGSGVLGEVDERISAFSGLEEALEKIQDGWTSREAERWFEEAGAEVLKASKNISDAARPEGERVHSRQYHREKAKEALESLSQEERSRVRDELMRGWRGKKREFRRVEREVRYEERAEAVRRPVERALRRAMEEDRVRRAEALDEAQERFEEVEEPVQKRVREEMGSGLEEQLEEALRPDRPSAKELRARSRQGSSQGRERSSRQDKSQDKSQDKDQGEGQDKNGSSGRGIDYDRGRGRGL